jgi:hypothetical protein
LVESTDQSSSMVAKLEVFGFGMMVVCARKRESLYDNFEVRLSTSVPTDSRALEWEKALLINSPLAGSDTFCESRFSRGGSVSFGGTKSGSDRTDAISRLSEDGNIYSTCENIL